MHVRHFFRIDSITVILIAAALLASLTFFLVGVRPAASQSSPTVIFLTSGSSWTVPSDWNSSNNTIEVIGGGGGGANGGHSSGNFGGAGGGGGAYSAVSNVTLTPGGSVAYAVGTGGGVSTNGSDTYFCNSTSNCASIAGTAVVVGAKGGAGASLNTGGTGGAAASGVGTTKNSGGGGGNTGSSSTSGGGAGGGGSAGPNGSGAGGGFSPTGIAGAGAGGGGGANNGSVGGDASGSNGAAGGNGRSGTGGGAAGNPNGGNGSQGGGGGGGDGSATSGGVGGAGGTETLWTQTSDSATAGPGGGAGGGGGAGNVFATAGNAGTAGTYGGGGGGGGDAPIGTDGVGSAGAQGIIVITYTPIPPTTVPGAPTSLNATASTNDISLTWNAPVDDGGSPITGYKVYRDTTSPAMTLFDTISPATSYIDSSALVNTTYYYRVKATNAVGDSAYSNEDSATRSCTQTAPTSANLHGWAWSDTIGWISLNSSDSGTCTSIPYGLTIAADGTISGYIWSENIGWISANSSDLSGCPTTPCTARMEDYAMKGWMKALAANQSEAAWDGWISLSGSSPNYGPTLSPSTGVFSGYAWGDTNLGWISFGASGSYEAVSTTWVPQCALQYVCTDETHRQNQCAGSTPEVCSGSLICSTGACVTPPAPAPNGAGNELKVSPRLVKPGNRATITWNIQYADSCTVTEDNPNITDSWTGISGSHQTSTLSIQTKYTLQCSGAGGTLTQTATVYLSPVWKEL